MAVAQITAPFSVEVYRVQNNLSCSNCVLLNVYFRIPTRTMAREDEEVNSVQRIRNILANPLNNDRPKYIIAMVSPGVMDTYSTSRESYELIVRHMDRNDIERTNFSYPGVLEDYEINTFDYINLQQRRCGLILKVNNVDHTTVQDLEEIISNGDQYPREAVTGFIIMRGPTPVAYTLNFNTRVNIRRELKQSGFLN